VDVVDLNLTSNLLSTIQKILLVRWRWHLVFTVWVFKFRRSSKNVLHISRTIRRI